MSAKLFTYCPFILPALLLVQPARAQHSVEAITQPLNAYTASHLQEKIFVHTDKSFYTAGELIWFKLYTTDGQTNHALGLSKLAYVEVLNKDRKPVLQAKIALDEGSGNGSFQLPYSINSGSFIFRAYTNWMKNESADYFFEKELTIVNTLKNPDWPAVAKTQYDVQFFPEGGNLINGIQARMGFKIVGSNGAGVNARGAILNQRNDTIAKFAALRYGMGHVDLLPDAGVVYHASVTMPDGTVVNKDLPAVNTSGIAMRLTDAEKDKLNISIQSKNAGSVVSLLVHTRGVTKMAVMRELFGGRTEIEIDKRQLGDGISHIVVFNEANQPVAERLYFKQPQALSINAHTDAQQYGERKKVTIDLSTTDAKQLPVAGDLSVSVYLIDELQARESGSIVDYLWLQSDLKGTVESPGYYFTSGADIAEAADNLMLTQGWRRFKWETVIGKAGAAPEFLPETEGHLVNGRVVDKRSGLPGENIVSFLSVPAEKPLFTGNTSGKNGAVRYNLKNFYGGNEIIVQTNPNTDSMYRIEIANPFSEKYSEHKPLVFDLTEKASAALINRSLGAQTANAYYADKRSFLLPAALDTTPFYGTPDKQYYLDDYTRFQTMEEVMREYVQDVHVHKNGNHFTYRVRNKSFDDFFDTNPLVLLDGVPVFDVDKIIAFDPLKIKKVDVVSQKFYQNNLVHDGIISYSTYQADLAGYALDANALIVEYEGMQLQREFYSPVYDNNTARRLPDFRNVLYWSPEIKTGKDGKKQLSFYTGDLAGKYGIMIQGLGANGLAGAQWLDFTVN